MQFPRKLDLTYRIILSVAIVYKPGLPNYMWRVISKSRAISLSYLCDLVLDFNICANDGELCDARDGSVSVYCINYQAQLVNAIVSLLYNTIRLECFTKRISAPMLALIITELQKKKKTYLHEPEEIHALAFLWPVDLSQSCCEENQSWFKQLISYCTRMHV